MVISLTAQQRYVWEELRYSFKASKLLCDIHISSLSPHSAQPPPDALHMVSERAAKLWLEKRFRWFAWLRSESLWMVRKYLYEKCVVIWLFRTTLRRSRLHITLSSRRFLIVIMTIKIVSYSHDGVSRVRKISLKCFVFPIFFQFHICCSFEVFFFDVERTVYDDGSRFDVFSALFSDFLVDFSLWPKI